MAEVTYQTVTWTTGDIITEAKMDNMVANDRAVDAMNNGIEMTERTAPTTPSATKIHLYAKDNGTRSDLYAKHDDGIESEIRKNSVIYDNGNSGTSATIDWSKGDTQKITLTGNCTFTFSNVVEGRYLTLYLVQDATGSRTVTFPSGTKHPGATAPTLTTTASAIDVIGIRAYGVSTYHVLASNFDLS